MQEQESDVPLASEPIDEGDGQRKGDCQQDDGPDRTSFHCCTLVACDGAEDGVLFALVARERLDPATPIEGVDGVSEPDRLGEIARGDQDATPSLGERAQVSVDLRPCAYINPRCRDPVGPGKWSERRTSARRLPSAGCRR